MIAEWVLVRDLQDAYQVSLTGGVEPPNYPMISIYRSKLLRASLAFSEEVGTVVP